MSGVGLNSVLNKQERVYIEIITLKVTIKITMNILKAKANTLKTKTHS